MSSNPQIRRETKRLMSASAMTASVKRRLNAIFKRGADSSASQSDHNASQESTPTYNSITASPATSTTPPTTTTKERIAYRKRPDDTEGNPELTVDLTNRRCFGALSEMASRELDRNREELTRLLNAVEDEDSYKILSRHQVQKDWNWVTRLEKLALFEDLGRKTMDSAENSGLDAPYTGWRPKRSAAFPKEIKAALQEIAGTVSAGEVARGAEPLSVLSSLLPDGDDKTELEAIKVEMHKNRAAVGGIGYSMLRPAGTTDPEPKATAASVSVKDEEKSGSSSEEL